MLTFKTHEIRMQDSDRLIVDIGDFKFSFYEEEDRVVVEREDEPTYFEISLSTDAGGDPVDGIQLYCPSHTTVDNKVSEDGTMVVRALLYMPD